MAQCGWCGAEFELRHRAHTLCSQHCGHARWRPRRERPEIRLPSTVVDKILAVAVEVPKLGPRAIAGRLRVERNGNYPVSQSSVWNVLKRAGLNRRAARVAAAESRRGVGGSGELLYADGPVISLDGEDHTSSLYSRDSRETVSSIQASARQGGLQ